MDSHDLTSRIAGSRNKQYRSLAVLPSVYLTLTYGGSVIIMKSFSIRSFAIEPYICSFVLTKLTVLGVTIA